MAIDRGVPEDSPTRPRLWMAAALCYGMAGPAAAGERDISATFYIWASGLSGTQSLFGLPPADVDLSFGDILDNVDMAAAGIVEIRGGRVGFLGEINYVDLSAEAAGPGGC